MYMGMMGTVFHAYNISTLEIESRRIKFKASLGNIARSCFNCPPPLPTKTMKGMYVFALCMNACVCAYASPHVNAVKGKGQKHCVLL